MEELHKRYGDRVAFLAVYVREAHPTDGWRMGSNDKAGIFVPQPRSPQERHSVAHKCRSTLEMTMPLVVDDLYDTVGHLYSGMPDRLYLIGRDGRVAYKGGRGPFGFKTGELEQALVMHLLDDAPPAAESGGVWKFLPPAERGAGRPLPAWAQALAPALPNTTAAMLELDYLHRVKSPLDPVLRGKMRWVAAHANRCAYAEAQAAADLRRAGVSEADIQALAGDPASAAPAERAALEFTRKLTLAADTVTDAEVARLIAHYGDKQVVAMVLLLAYANFQDRLLLALGLAPESGDALLPVEVKFVRKDGPEVQAPRRRPPEGNAAPTVPEHIADADWSALDFARLQKEMEGQRGRSGRVRVPAWDEVRKHLPPGYPADRPLRIQWSLVCTGHQPELALAWSACTRAFAQDAKQDRVFEESLFWVVTRSLRCFY